MHTRLERVESRKRKTPHNEGMERWNDHHLSVLCKCTGRRKRAAMPCAGRVCRATPHGTRPSGPALAWHLTLSSCVPAQSCRVVSISLLCGFPRSPAALAVLHLSTIRVLLAIRGQRLCRVIHRPETSEWFNGRMSSYDCRAPHTRESRMTRRRGAMRRIENRNLRCARCFRAPGRATAARRGAPHAQIQDERSLGNHPARGPVRAPDDPVTRCTNDDARRP